MRIFFFCFTLAAIVASSAPSVEQIFKSGILPDCQQLVYCENSALAANPLLAPYLSGLSEYRGPDGSAMAAGNEHLPALFKVVRAVTDKMPIRNFAAVRRSQICVDWSAAAADPKNAYKSVKYLLVYELNEETDPSSISALIASEAAARKVTLNSVFDAEQEILTISYPAIPDLPACSIAFFHAGKVLMIGETALLQSAANKAKRLIPPATLPSALQAAREKIPADAQFYLLFAPDDNIRAAMQNKAPDSPAGPTIEEIVCAAFTLQAGEKLGLRLGLDFSTPQTASMGKAMLLDGFFMGMLKMYLTQNTSPDLPVLKTMGTTLDGSHAAFACALTGQDIQTITPLFRQLFQSFAERAALP